MLLPGMMNEEEQEKNNATPDTEPEPELTTAQMLEALRNSPAMAGQVPPAPGTEEELTEQEIRERQRDEAMFGITLQQQFQLQKEEWKDRLPDATPQQINNILQAKWNNDDDAFHKAYKAALQTEADIAEKNEKQESLQVTGGQSSENRTATRGGSLNRILSILDAT